MLITRPGLTPDPIWSLSRQYASDARPHKVDLTLGVYRDETLDCPVMEAVHLAEQRLLDRRESKQYRSPSGLAAFNDRLTELLLGPELAQSATSIQTVAGTGALRLLAEFLAYHHPGRRVILGTPSYINHIGVLQVAGLNVSPVPFVDAHNIVDLSPLLDAIGMARPGDAVLLQGCCHNPTGASLSDGDWDVLAAAIRASGVVPFFDQAYFGLGDGLQSDLAPMRRVLATVPEAVVAVSCSKSFSLYSERTGSAIVLAGNRDGVADTLEAIARTSYSQPPHHGAALVAEVLGSDDLKLLWALELEAMRVRLTSTRDALATSLEQAGLPGFVGGIRDQRGMFARLPLSEAQMEALRRDHGFYGLTNGRLNLAGLPSSRIQELASAVRGVVD